MCSCPQDQPGLDAPVATEAAAGADGSWHQRLGDDRQLGLKGNDDTEDFDNWMQMIGDNRQIRRLNRGSPGGGTATPNEAATPAYPSRGSSTSDVRAGAGSGVGTKADSSETGQYSLKSLEGNWRDTKGSVYDVTVFNDTVEVWTTRPTGETLKSRRLIGWDDERKWIVWGGRPNTRAYQYWLTELGADRMKWERPSSAPFQWERIALVSTRQLQQQHYLQQQHSLQQRWEQRDAPRAMGGSQMKPPWERKPAAPFQSCSAKAEHTAESAARQEEERAERDEQLREMKEAWQQDAAEQPVPHSAAKGWLGHAGANVDGQAAPIPQAAPGVQEVDQEAPTVATRKFQ